jgi:para-nitrobenzyl esterase
LNFERKLNVTSVAGLRALSALEINNAQPFSLNQDPGVTGFAPSIDRYVIPIVPGRAFHNGLQLKIPLLAGIMSDEQYLFEGNALPHNTSQEFESAAKILFGDRLPEFVSLYPDNISAFLNASSGALVGDLYIRQQTWEAALTHRRTTNMPVFAYYYTYASMYEPIPTHTAEIPFVFDNLLNNPLIGSVLPPDPQDQTFSRYVMAYWVSFAKTGNPNTLSATTATWPEYGSGGEDYLELGVATQPFAPQFLAQHEFIASFRNDGVLPLSWRNLSSLGI